MVLNTRLLAVLVVSPFFLGRCIACADDSTGAESTRSGKVVGHLKIKGEFRFPIAPGDDAIKINEKNRGLANVFVVMQFRDRTLIPLHQENVVHKVTAKDHRFSPRAVLLQKGDMLEIHNQERFDFFLSDENLGIPICISEKNNRSLPLASTSIPQTYCNIISRETKGVYFVSPHPFASLSDEEGRFVIHQVPVGTHKFRIFHEHIRSSRVVIDSKEVPVANARLEYQVRPGENNIGVIELPAEDFQ